jgi:hypothetical protein
LELFGEIGAWVFLVLTSSLVHPILHHMLLDAAPWVERPSLASAPIRRAILCRWHKFTPSAKSGLTAPVTEEFVGSRFVIDASLLIPIIVVVVLILVLLVVLLLLVVVAAAAAHLILGVLTKLVVLDLFLLALILISFIVILFVALLLHVFLELLATRDEAIDGTGRDRFPPLFTLLAAETAAVGIGKVPLIFRKMSLDFVHVEVLTARNIEDPLNALLGNFVQICEVALILVGCIC